MESATAPSRIEPEPATPVLTIRRAWALIAVLAACWALLLAARPALTRAATLYPLELPPNPHFVPEHALFLYLLVPVVVCACVCGLVAPGVLVVLAQRGATSVTDLVLRGFALTFAIRWMAGLLYTGLLDRTWSPLSFLVTDLAITATLAGLLLMRVRSTRPPQWLAEPAVERRRLAWMLGLPLACAIAFLPWLLWQDMNGDGLEILESGRALATFAMPRFPHPSGFQGLGLGIIATAFPVHWFVMLLGPFEAAARLPFLLYLPLLLAVLIELIEERSPRRLRSFEEFALALAVASFATTLAMNSSYDPYMADIAAPAAVELLTVVSISAFLLFLWRRETIWFVGFVVLAYFTRPSAPLVLLLLTAVTLALRPGEWRGLVGRVGLALGACILVNIAYEIVYVPWASGGMEAGYRGGSILRRLQFLEFGDVQRLLFVIVPSGFLPAAALFAIRRQDHWARTLTLLCLAYFAFFYVQAFIALHHFAPVMILPAVVLWRIALRSQKPRFIAPAAAAGALAGLLLALPSEPGIYRSVRTIGARMTYRIGDYFSTYPRFRGASDGRRILVHLFRGPHEIPDPATELSLSNLTLVYYAARFGPDPAKADYVAQPMEAAPPPGFFHVATADGRSVFVRDSTIWHRDRHTAPKVDFGSPLYRLPQNTLFNYRGIRAQHYDFNLGSLPFIWRLFD